jgi:hypothetical protein
VASKNQIKSTSPSVNCYYNIDLRIHSIMFCEAVRSPKGPQQAAWGRGPARDCKGPRGGAGGCEKPRRAKKSRVGDRGGLQRGTGPQRVAWVSGGTQGYARGLTRLTVSVDLVDGYGAQTDDGDQDRRRDDDPAPNRELDDRDGTSSRGATTPLVRSLHLRPR